MDSYARSIQELTDAMTKIVAKVYREQSKQRCGHRISLFVVSLFLLYRIDPPVWLVKRWVDSYLSKKAGSY